MIRIFYCLFVFTLLTACSQKIIYLTPSASGQLIDATSNQPIKNSSGLVGFSLNENMITTDNNGFFNAKARTIHYSLIRPNLGRTPTFRLYISFDKYNPRIINYSKYSITPPSAGYDKPSHVDIGKVYLTPIKDGEAPVMESDTW